MYILGVSDHVMIAHSLGDPSFGPAQRLHGATYVVQAEVRVPKLGATHVVMDIGVLRQLLREVLAELDYRNLDDHPGFPDRTSTTERVATYIADGLAQRLSVADPTLRGSLRVLLHESPVAYAAYEREL